MDTKTRSGPREVFFHLLLIITLYMSVVSGITLLFQYVNVWFPDVLSFYRPGIFDAIRWASSVLLVAFPVFLGVSWQLEKDFTAAPATRDLRIRKWLVYLTLFIAALTIITDLIVLIYTFYGGEITTRFILKVLVVLAVAGMVFGYYLWDLRRGTRPSKLPRQAAWGTGVLAAVAIIAGFFLAGSPAQQRQVRFDEQRVSDMQQIQSQLINYWTQKSALPTSLNQLNDSISGFTTPTDPVTHQPYAYTVKDPHSFELCATFAMSDQASPAGPASVPQGAYQDSWNHGAGRTCFNRTIDPQLYKPAPASK